MGFNYSNSIQNRKKEAGYTASHGINQRHDAEFTHGLCFTAYNVGIFQFAGREPRAALVAVEYLAGFAMAEGITVGGCGPIFRGKVGAFAAGFFIGDTEKSAVVFPESAMPGFFVMAERQGVRNFMQHGAANQLRIFRAKPCHKMSRESNAARAVVATA